VASALESLTRGFGYLCRPSALSCPALPASFAAVASSRRMSPRPYKPPIGGSVKLIGFAEVAEILGVSKSTVKKNWRVWGLRGYRIGQLVKFKQREVESWIDAQAELNGLSRARGYSIYRLDTPDTFLMARRAVSGVFGVIVKLYPVHLRGAA
jgi:excisionase family DNA binding protein